MYYIKVFSVIVGILLVLLIGGCTKHYIVTQDLTQSISQAAVCRIGELIDELPPDFKEEDKPTLEDMDKFKGIIHEELNKADIFRYVEFGGTDSKYEVNGSILNYAKGSGAVRFLFGMGLGSAKLTAALNLVDIQSNTVIFSANFSRTISGGFQSGDDAYRYIAIDFAKEIKKQMKKLDEQ